MHEMKTKHPATWQELEDGNISVTKSEIPFVSIGADHVFRSVSMRTEQVRSTSNNSHPFNTPLYLHQSLIIFTDLNH